MVTLAAYIGYGRYRALQTYTRLLQRSGITITHETDGFTYSQSVQGKTIFTIHAAKAVQHGEGQWTLHDVVMTFYGREPGVTDHIQASEVEYDEKQGVARAQGEVHMDLQAPQALSGTHPEQNKQEDAADVYKRQTQGYALGWYMAAPLGLNDCFNSTSVAAQSTSPPAARRTLSLIHICGAKTRRWWTASRT